MGVAKNPEKQVKTLMKNFANFKDRYKKNRKRQNRVFAADLGGQVDVILKTLSIYIPKSKQLRRV